jgi:tyrosyl-tRNA synthetase
MSSELLAQIKMGAEELLPEDTLKDKLAENRPLRVKLGCDPTASDIHLGHTVVLNKCRQLQNLGHRVQFLIGDFTAQIGDPTGKNKTREPLSREAIEANAKTYQEQAFKILDPEKTDIVYNNDWLGKMSAADLIGLAARSTVARMLERDDFDKRYKGNQPIAIHEFLYPLLQGYDSVHLKTDLELGGTDQKFNLLMGRELQKQFGQPGQAILTMPLLEGLDGVKKMSKSLGNYIGVTDKPDDMFGKIMSVSDELMWRYYSLLSFLPAAAQLAMQKEIADGGNPRDYKVKLAMELVDRFHGVGAGEKSYAAFVARFKQNLTPDDIEDKTVFMHDDGKMPIASALKQAGLVSSTSDGIRMVKQGAVKIDGEKVENPKLELPEDFDAVVQVGKRRFAKVKVAK